ncbi:YetF domain-containing protein [Alkalihalobacillus deserti]|uniref:YetF domain-containing protein n=1 Tax=Alkalihalobacillus deserti TaxID=2879466 RepID=UPI001D15760D
MFKVHFYHLEKNGQVSVMKKSELQPLTPKDVGKITEQGREPRIVILDGNVMERSLSE